MCNKKNLKKSQRRAIGRHYTAYQTFCTTRYIISAITAFFLYPSVMRFYHRIRNFPVMLTRLGDTHELGYFFTSAKLQAARCAQKRFFCLPDVASVEIKESRVLM